MNPPRFRCPDCRRGEWPASTTPAACPSCGTAQSVLDGVWAAGSADGTQERWQREIYDDRAYSLETPPSRDGFESLLLTHREHARWLDELRLGPDDRVLDIGCSDGRFLDLMSARYGVRGGVGLDVSPKALAAGARRGANGHRFALSSAERELPFGDACFDAVTCFDVLEHLADPGAALREVRRVLAPGGRALFHMPVSDFRFSADWVDSRLRPAKWAEGMRAAGHDYSVILTRAGYETAVRGAGLEISRSRRFNSLLQNVFDYRMVHRVLNRMFYVHRLPFSLYHRALAPAIELLVAPDRALQLADVGASLYVLARAPA